MKTVIWKLTPGGGKGQMLADQKLAEGLEYVERLKAEGEVVENVENTGKELVITLQDNG